MLNLTKNKIFLNFLSLSVLQGLNLIIPLLTFPYLIRILGVNNFGVLAFINALIIYFQVLTDYGFNATATRDISIANDDKEKINTIFSDVISTKIFLTFIGFLILTIIIFIIPKFRENWEICYYTFGLVIGQMLLPVWFFQGIQSMKYITYVNIISRGGATIFIFFLIKNQDDYKIVPIINSLGAIIGGILSLYYAHHKFNIKFKFSSFKGIIKQLNHGKYMFLSELKITLFTNTNLLILGFLKGDTAVGYFSAAEKLVRAIGNIQLPFNNAIYPYLSKLIIKDTKKAYTFILKITKYGTFISLLIIIPCFFLSDLIIKLLYSPAMLPSVTPFKILLLIPLCSFLDTIFGKQILLNLGKDNIYFNVILGATILNLGINFIMTYYFSYIGTAISLIFTQILIDIGMIYFANKQINSHIKCLKTN